jgi:CubicO group peptidase (beta-lactamase class C family)
MINKIKFSQWLVLVVGLAIFISCEEKANKTEILPYSFKKVTPEQVNVSSDSLLKVDNFLQMAVDSQWVAGAVSLGAKDGSIFYERSFGYRDIESSDKMEINDLFRIASMSKPITTVAILQLYEKGLLKFNDPVSNYIPEFSDVRVLESFNESDTTYVAIAASEQITIHHLLTHTSGLAYGFTDPIIGKIYAKNSIVEGMTLKPISLKTNIAQLAKLPLKHNPGESWTYGLSIDVLGRVVEVASGLPFDQYLKQNIFDPLNMLNTGFYFSDSVATELTTLYSNHPEKKLVPFPHYPDNDVTGQFPIIGAKTYFSGGAGLVSTAHDYLRFCQAILNDGQLGDIRILQPETVALMQQNMIGDLSLGGLKFSYGYSITTADSKKLNGESIGRMGWTGIFQTLFWIDPSQNVVGILMTQVYPKAHQGKLFDGFEQGINTAILKKTGE